MVHVLPTGLAPAARAITNTVQEDIYEPPSLGFGLRRPPLGDTEPKASGSVQARKFMHLMHSRAARLSSLAATDEELDALDATADYIRSALAVGLYATTDLSLPPLVEGTDDCTLLPIEAPHRYRLVAAHDQPGLATLRNAESPQATATMARTASAEDNPVRGVTEDRPQRPPAQPGCNSARRNNRLR